MHKPLIEVRGLVNKFGNLTVHNGLDFDIYPAEIVAIVGGNGTGKSVLLRSIVGLQCPTAGRVMIGNKNIHKLALGEFLDIQKMWGVLFQKGALFSNMTVIENVSFQLQEKTDLSAADIYKIAKMKIDLVGLPSHARDKYPSQLSGGMTKRAALARALALDPKILFLDEPTAGLDPVAADQLDHLVRDLVDYLGLSAFIITHDLDTMNNICDRVCVLVDQKMRSGTLQDHLKDDHPWVYEYFHNARARFMTRG